MKRRFTPKGIEKVKKELRYLEKEKRKEVAKNLKYAASFGDLSENSAYEDAKNEQVALESKISKLKEMLKEAEVVEVKKGSETVQTGSEIIVESEGEKKKMEIVGGTEADPYQGKISSESPMGQAFLNKKKGDICIVETPSGEKRFKILEVI